jgi:hypothetical protein
MNPFLNAFSKSGSIAVVAAVESASEDVLERIGRRED